MSGKSSRWCNARQVTIDNARRLVDSNDCTYDIKGLEVEARVTKVADLLHEEAFHFAPRANSVSGQRFQINKLTTLTTAIPERPK
jgi:hypothetical protein